MYMLHNYKNQLYNKKSYKSFELKQYQKFCLKTKQTFTTVRFYRHTNQILINFGGFIVSEPTYLSKLRIRKRILFGKITLENKVCLKLLFGINYHLLSQHRLNMNSTHSILYESTNFVTADSQQDSGQYQIILLNNQLNVRSNDQQNAKQDLIKNSKMFEVDHVSKMMQNVYNQWTRCSEQYQNVSW
ncbi:Hypothetical_protein [Hexamita inflata]|uniref:Hypothetical_protein n=1 Tax=Hexamita inflata TaxID=28002 RepID=A0AA86QB31_9EUKA|nr:Hypothetical protein HINF_LOCUS41381 [Hexamita inflata]